MSDPLKSFTTDELHALIFRLGLSETIEPLDEVAAELCDEMMREIKARDAWFSDHEHMERQCLSYIYVEERLRTFIHLVCCMTCHLKRIYEML
jgi:hypothetical protein